MKAIILAGGSGTRLWPLSREKQPKQLQSILGGKTLLQTTYERLLKLVKPDDIFVATGKADLPVIKTQLPKLPLKNIFVEPERKGTAAAIGAVVASMTSVDPEEVFVVINSDAHVTDVTEYITCIRMGEELVLKKPGYIALIGVKPTYAETGYGYIHLGAASAWVGEEGNQRLAHSVDRFVEKPDAVTASQYVLSGDYLWNPTLIISQAGPFLERYHEHAPEIYRELVRIRDASGKTNEKTVVADAFEKMPAESVDRVILEKGGKMAVVPATFGWRDIGDWRAIYDVRADQESDAQKNVTRGQVVCIEASGNLLCTDEKKVLAVIGVEDLVIIDTADALLICPRNRAQHVKQIVVELKKRGMHKFL